MAIIKKTIGDYAYPHEKEQFDVLSRIISEIEQLDAAALGSGFLLGNIYTSSYVALDALLLTTKLVVGIEFKNYPQDSTVEITPNVWKVLQPNGTPHLNKEGGPLFVKGGTYATPFEQAQTNHSKLVKDIKNHTGKESLKIPFAIVFNKKLKITGNTALKEEHPWLTVTHNDNFKRVLLSLAQDGSYKAFDTAADLNNYEAKLGADCEAVSTNIDKATEFEAAGQYLRAYNMVKSYTTKAAYLLRIICSFELKREDILDTLLAAENDYDLAEAYYTHGWLLEHGFTNIKCNREHAKKKYELALKYGDLRGWEALNRMDEREREEAEKERNRREEERKKQEEAAILETLKLHDSKVYLWVTLTKISLFLYFIVFYLRYFSWGHWADILMYGVWGIPLLATFVLPYLGGKTIDFISRHISLYNAHPQMMSWGGTPQVETKYYDSAEDLVKQKALSATLMLGVFALVWVGLLFLQRWDFFQTLDWKVLPLVQCVSLGTHLYLLVAASLAACMISQFCDSAEADGGVKPGIRQVRLWSRFALYLLKVCMISALLIVVPSVNITNVKNWYKQRKMGKEQVEQVDVKGKSASSKSARSQLTWSKVAFKKPFVFDHGSAAMTSHNYDLVCELAKMMKEEPGMILLVYGCIDRAERQNNLDRLRSRRAAAVKDAICREGIAAKRITAKEDAEATQRTVTVLAHLMEK